MDVYSLPLLDAWNRPMRRLRLSLTDRCNLRCRYCMAKGRCAWIPARDILNFAEIEKLVEVFTGLGVHRIHLTGGDPLLRKGVDELVARLAQNERIDDLSMITNGVLLAQKADSLLRAGLQRITVSLDTLWPDRFRELTGKSALPMVLEGIRAARQVGVQTLKINMVVIRGVNDDELVDMIEFGKSLGAEVRFIEYMAMGGAELWSPEQVVSQEEIRARLERHYGLIETVPRQDSAPARHFLLSDGTRFGIIAPVTKPFCGDCDRGRLTADGMWHLCLRSPKGLDLRSLLRAGASTGEIRSLVAQRWQRRQERGGEESRTGASSRTQYLPDGFASQIPLRMHALGG